MNKREALKVVIKILVVEIIILTIASVTRLVIGKGYFLADAANFGWILGVFGTLYAFIAAFVLIGVWNQFNDLSSLVAKEAMILTSLWNFADYLNDGKVDGKMKEALINYLNKTINEEMKKLSEDKPVETYSSELLKIGKVIDRIEFDDKRDESAFSLIIDNFRQLMEVRDRRNEVGITRLPLSLKLLFEVVSVLFVTSSIVLGFVNMPLYLFSVGFSGFIAVMIFEIIKDLDNPFGGIFNLEPKPFYKAREYVLKTKHSK